MSVHDAPIPLFTMGRFPQYREAVERDGETDTPEHWATLAFAAWTDDDEGARAIEPLTTEEARTEYVAAFLRALDGAR